MSHQAPSHLSDGAERSIVGGGASNVKGNQHSLQPARANSLAALVCRSRQCYRNELVTRLWCPLPFLACHPAFRRIPAAIAAAAITGVFALRSVAQAPLQPPVPPLVGLRTHHALIG